MRENGARLRLLLSVVVFGTIGLFVRFIPLPSGLIALSRGVTGTLVILLFLAVRKRRLCLADIWRNLLMLCLSGAALGFNWMLLFEAYRYTTVAVATLCYHMAPVMLILASPLLFREKLTWSKLLCVGAAVFGIVLVSGVLKPGANAGTQTAGVLLGLGAAVMYACLIVFNKRLRGISSMDTTVVQLGVSALVLLPYTLLAERVAPGAFTPRTVVLLATVGVLHTGVAYVLYFGAIGKLPVQTVAIFSYLDSVTAILLSTLVLREKLDAVGIVGAILILGGTMTYELLAMRKKDPAPTLRQMTDQEIRDWHETELVEAFLPQERKPVADIFALKAADRYDVWGLFEPAHGGERLIGYATVARVEGLSCVLLDYLGVTASRRGQGVGGKILEMLKPQYPDMHILVEAELPLDHDDSAENAVRERRVAFYRRCGFEPVYVMAACGMRWQALLYGAKTDIERVMSDHRLLYSAERTDVQVPILPHETPRQPYWMQGI